MRVPQLGQKEAKPTCAACPERFFFCCKSDIFSIPQGLCRLILLCIYDHLRSEFWPIRQALGLNSLFWSQAQDVQGLRIFDSCINDLYLETYETLPREVSMLLYAQSLPSLLPS